MSARRGAYRPHIPEACAVLRMNGNKMPIGALAKAVGVAVRELRAEVQAYGELEDSPTIYPMGSQAFLFIASGADEDADPEGTDDDVVELMGSPEEFLGTERFDARVLGPLYTAAEDLLAQEPDNAALASAATKLREEFLPGVAPRRNYRKATVAALAEAIRDTRCVRIVYSRAWQPGVGERVIEPYRLVNTRRGYEVDAGPLDAEGQLRTFLVSRIREWEVLGEAFERPDDVMELSRVSRETVAVSGFVPHEGRWAINKYAEGVVWQEGAVGESEVYFTAEVLPPVAERVALMVLSAGEGTALDEPEYDESIAALGRELWEHHGLGSGE